MKQQKDLKELRAEIDAVDREMTRLFEKRLAIVDQIAEYKAAYQLPVLDAARETQVIEHNLKQLSSEKNRRACIDFYTAVMRISREREN